ncbi:vWA domain-containing protein [Massilia sp. YIM B04103]|uniref:vWA domain-containing protein n=2 Tax=unclassified Massilia TaxID=2609279 RepID=UPI00210F1BFB|nr:vWA domain-containing protein [Massilia sp. YIM B04103]
MKSNALAQRALTLMQKKHDMDRLRIVHAAEISDPDSGEGLYDFTAVSPDDPNGPSWRILLSEDGKERERHPALEPMASATRRVEIDAAALGMITIKPDSNVLTLNPDDTLDETITVTVPKNAGVAKADIYFLADTTGSMGEVLAAVQAGANNVLTALSGLGMDLMFGVGNYRDFPPMAPSPFSHQLNPTNAAPAVTAAIGAWSASGGGDTAEGQFLALEQLAQAPGGSIGWRAGAKRIIVWIGDAPGHDPICTAISGLASAITEASATAALSGQGIAVLAISTATPGLDDDPVALSSDYAGPCGAPGGSAGQGTRVAAATGGAFVSGIKPDTIVKTIIDMVTGAVSSIANLKLVASAGIAPFVVSIDPAGGYGPLAGEREHVLEFRVKFHGIACAEEEKIVNGTLDVVVDGAVAAAKTVKITVPPCRPKVTVYSVKFVCGTQHKHPECCCTPVRPGHYATQITIHNHTDAPITLRKRFIPVVLAGAPLGREPKVGLPRAEDTVVLPPHSATMDDCCRITELLFGSAVDALTIGILEISAPGEVSVTALYTTDKAIEVKQIHGHKPAKPVGGAG